MLSIHFGEAGGAEFWAAVLQILVINILLSGDNAVVIAMTCRGLPPRQRFWGLVAGAGAAVIIRLMFAGIVGQLMQLPYLKLAGGVALLYIAATLLVPDRSDRNNAEAAAHLWRAVRIVVAADIVMSLDNVIALAAVANGDLLLLAIGLAISIPLVIAGAALIMGLLERFPIFVWAGAGLLGWVAGEVIATDPAISSFLITRVGEKAEQQLVWAAAAAGVVIVLAAGSAWRHWQMSKIRAAAERQDDA
jgi:YjbE family integral membrane protein